MKQLFKDFKNYYAAANHPPVRQTSLFRVLLLYAMLIAFIIIEEMAFTSSPLYGDGSVSVIFSPAILPIIALHLILHAVKYKPTLAALTPVSYKRRALYDILFPIIISIFMFICIIVLFLIIIGIVYLAAPESFIEEDGEAVGIGVGNIAIFFRFLFAYGCNLVIACQTKTKPKTILSVAFVAVYWAATLLTGYAINGFNAEAGANAIYATQFNNMALPWLGYMLWAIAGIGAFAAAVLYLIKFEKPKEY